MPLTAGTRLGPYEIISPLGAGGMGEVYRATDTKLKRDVAIKILPASLGIDIDRLARFQREAEVLASLNHPNIAAIYGLEETGGVAALVMELVDGEDLSQRIARGAIPLDEALPIAKQVAEALEAAHGQGIIHRDLKPANIKLRADGTVKVLDFGLAKAMEPAGVMSASVSMSPTITTPAMTQAGVILGTAAYMSPEQARGREVDQRADIWAFGVVVYEMLTGRSAFAGEDISITLAAVLKDEPGWQALPPATPPPVRTLLRRCLQKDSKKRLPHIGMARIEIDDVLSGVLVSAPDSVDVASSHRPGALPLWKRALPVLAGAIVAGALAGTIWRLRSSPDSPGVTRFSVPLGEQQQFTSTNRSVIALSPDGTRMVYVANRRLYLRSMSEDEAKPITAADPGGSGASSPVFSPDSRAIAFYSSEDQTLKRIPVAGGAAITICPIGNPFGMSWDATGILVGQGNNGIWRVAATGGKPERLFSTKDDEFAFGPQMLPDGQSVLFSIANGRTPSAWDTAQIVVQSAASNARKTLIQGGSDARYLPTGHIVYAQGGILFAVPFDANRLTVTGAPVSVVEGVQRGVSMTSTTGTAHFSVSATGTLAYQPGPTSTSGTELAWVGPKEAVARLKLPANQYEQPRVSPDGKQLAVGTDDSRVADVWIYDVSGATALRKLTFGGRNRLPVWSADGQRIAFQSDREGASAIYWQRADGTGPAERLTAPESGSEHMPESFSPNGDRLLFSVEKNQAFSLQVLSMADRRVTPFANVRSPMPANAVFSPDGRWVAYSVQSQATSVFVTNVLVQPFPPTGATYQVGRGAIHPLWSVDGRALFFTPFGRLTFVNVSTSTGFAVSEPTQVPRGGMVDPGPRNPRPYDFAPDGRMIGIVLPGKEGSAAAAPLIHVVLNWFEELKARVPTK